MGRQISAAAMVCGAMFAAPALAAPMVDDFSSDTSANYTVTNGTITIADGTLTANNGSTTNTSVNVIHQFAQLEVGEYAAVDVLTNPREAMLIVGTAALQPNSEGSSGIRLSAFSTAETVRVRVYGSGTSTTSDTTFSNIAGVTGLYIFRDTETSFQVGYDSGSGVQILGDPLTVPNTSGVSGMYIGLQFFHNVADSDFVVDNLRIVPEPGTLGLLGFASLLSLRRRRVA